MKDTPSSSRPRLYIQDSSDEDLPERADASRRKNHRRYQNKGKPCKLREDSRHLIRQEVSPGSNAPRPFRGVSQLLEKPVKPNIESIEESESDNEQLGETQLIPPTALPKALQFSNEAAALVTPLPNPRSFRATSWENAAGHNRVLFDARDQDVVEDAEDEALTSSKKQRVDESTPGPQQRRLLAEVENPASAHRSFLASKLTNLANVPSSARRLTPKKGMLLGHCTGVASASAIFSYCISSELWP